MKKIFSSKYFPFVLYFLVSSILLLPALWQSGLPFKYDWSWPLLDSRLSGNQIFDFSNLSIITVFSRYTDLFFTIFNFIINNPSVSLKIYLLLVTTTAAFGFHLLIKDKISSRVLTLIAPVIYAFSPYLFIRIIVGFQTSQVAYAALPFFYYFYFRKQKVDQSLRTSYCSSLSRTNSRLNFSTRRLARRIRIDAMRFNYVSPVDIRNLLFAALALSFVFAQFQAGVLVSLTIFVSLFISIFCKSFVSEIKKVLILGGWFVLINSPWLIALFARKSNITVNSGTDATTLSSIASLPHSLRNVLMLSDHAITRDFFYALARDKFIVLAFGLIFLVALISILDKQLRRYVLIFGLSALAILPFTVGPTGKFGAIFSWTFNHFPKLALFRETYHFEFLLAFALVFLFAIGADYLVSRVKINRQVSAVILASLGLFIIAPFLTFNFAGYLNLQKIPSEYQNAAKYLRDSSSCSKIYYPPNLGFVYFKADKSRDAANSDLLAKFTGVPHLSEDSSVLNLANEEMFERNFLTSLYLNKNDDGQFAGEFEKSGLDCLIVRTDLDTKYDQVSNLWREKDLSIRSKWFQSDMLALARSKVGLEEVKSFGDSIYIFKTMSNTNVISTEFRRRADERRNLLTDLSTPLRFARDDSAKRLIILPITEWARDYDYYKDGWSRGRYAFWRKELFAALKQDFLYTDKPDARLTGEIDQKGKYELWARYLTGGTAGSYQISFDESSRRTQEDSSHSAPLSGAGSNNNFQIMIAKDSVEERFVWKDLGQVDINNSQIEIKNISGENAIADLVLVALPE